jgi:hypothetical protein
VEIRKARGRDLGSLEAIERSSFHEERFQRWLLQSMIGEKGFHTLVALEDGKVVGYSSAIARQPFRCRDAVLLQIKHVTGMIIRPPERIHPRRV